MHQLISTLWPSVPAVIIRRFEYLLCQSIRTFIRSAENILRIRVVRAFRETLCGICAVVIILVTFETNLKTRYEIFDTILFKYSELSLYSIIHVFYGLLYGLLYVNKPRYSVGLFCSTQITSIGDFNVSVLFCASVYIVCFKVRRNMYFE